MTNRSHISICIGIWYEHYVVSMCGPVPSEVFSMVDPVKSSPHLVWSPCKTALSHHVDVFWDPKKFGSAGTPLTLVGSVDGPAFLHFRYKLYGLFVMGCGWPLNHTTWVCHIWSLFVKCTSILQNLDYRLHLRIGRTPRFWVKIQGKPYSCA